MSVTGGHTVASQLGNFRISKLSILVGKKFFEAVIGNQRIIDIKLLRRR